MYQVINLIIGPFLMICIFTYFCYFLINENNINLFSKDFILLFCINFFIHLVIAFLFNDTIKTLSVFIIDAIYCYLLFDITFGKAIYITFLEMIILIIPEMIELYFIKNILNVNIDFLYENYAGSIIANLFICIFFVILINILKKILKKAVNVKIEINSKIILFSIVTFICIIMFFYTLIKEFRFSNNIFLYIGAIIILIVVLFSLIKQTIENNKLIEKYDKLLEFMTTYENEIEKQRILRHETKNEFLAIKAKLYDKQKNKEIIDYIDEILKDKIKVNQEKYAKFGYLPANGIKGLCYFKVQEAENLGIKVSINISTKIKKSSIYNLGIKNQRDLGKLLGVFLDNAIEASNKSKKKQLGIEIYVTKNKETTITITNTFDNEINKNKIGKEKFTTKGKNRGHGLLLANHIINKNNTFKIKTEILNELYIQTIFINNNMSD